MSRNAWKEVPSLQGGGLVVTPMSCSGLWAGAAHCSLVAVPRRGELGSHPGSYPDFFLPFQVLGGWGTGASSGGTGEGAAWCWAVVRYG